MSNFRFALTAFIAVGGGDHASIAAATALFAVAADKLVVDRSPQLHYLPH